MEVTGLAGVPPSTRDPGVILPADASRQGTYQRGENRLRYCNTAYSLRAEIRMGMSGSASFHSARKSMVGSLGFGGVAGERRGASQAQIGERISGPQFRPLWSRIFWNSTAASGPSQQPVPPSRAGRASPPCPGSGADSWPPVPQRAVSPPGLRRAPERGSNFPDERLRNRPSARR